MKKNSFFNFSLLCALLLGSIAPIVAQPAVAEGSHNQGSLRQRISRMLPRPSLPSWAKGPGFEAAKKWWNAGRDKSVLTKKEKRAFNRLKKKFKIGAIISAIVIAAGGTRYYQVRKQRAAAQAQAAASAQAATTIQAAWRNKKRRDRAAQQRVKNIFNTSTGQRSVKNISQYGYGQTPDEVLHNAWVDVTNDIYYLIGIERGFHAPYAGTSIYFDEPTITYGPSKNTASFSVKKSQRFTSQVGTVEIIESTENGAYTYRARFRDTENTPHDIPIYITPTGIIRVKLTGDLSAGNDQLFDTATSSTRVNYFG